MHTCVKTGSNDDSLIFLQSRQRSQVVHELDTVRQGCGPLDRIHHSGVPPVGSHHAPDDIIPSLDTLSYNLHATFHYNYSKVLFDN